MVITDNYLFPAIRHRRYCYDEKVYVRNQTACRETVQRRQKLSSSKGWLIAYNTRIPARVQLSEFFGASRTTCPLSQD